MSGIRLIRKLLADRKYRWRYQLFWVDGVNFVHQALKNNWGIDTLVYAPKLIDSDFKKETIAKVPQARHLKVEPGEYAYLSTKQEVQGVGAVVKMKYAQQPIGAPGVVLEHLANPGNVGTILRTCVAFGLSTIYIINPSVDPFSFEAVRASMGAIFYANLVFLENISQLANYRNIGTSLDGMSINNYSMIMNDNSLVWFGNEARGLTSEAKEVCKTLVKIPISPNVDSLNVAESAAIVLYDFFVRPSLSAG